MSGALTLRLVLLPDCRLVLLDRPFTIPSSRHTDTLHVSHGPHPIDTIFDVLLRLRSSYQPERHQPESYIQSAYFASGCITTHLHQGTSLLVASSPLQRFIVALLGCADCSPHTRYHLCSPRGNKTIDSAMWEYSRGRSLGRPPRAAALLALASTTSALSLANFQIITSNSIPSPCIVAYNAQIAGCTQTDFTNGNQCSSLCINGLRAEATIVQAICGGLDVNAKSLLGLVLDGNVLETLCPGADSGTTTVQVTVQPSTSSKSTATTTSAQTLTTTSSAQETTTATSTSIQTTSSTAIIDTPSLVSSTTETTISTTTADSQTTQATSTTSVATTATSAASTTTDSSTEPLKGGGGSPFDAVVQGRATNLAVPVLGIFAPLLGAAMILL